MLFKGSIPAVITPFDIKSQIDYDDLANHIEFLITEGSHGLVSCGTTGESPTLNHDEHKKLTEFMQHSNQRNSPRKLRSLSPDTSSGRIEDWTGILKSVSGKGFFFGYGSQGDRYLINQSASNGLIYAYSSSGIFGLIILISFSTFVLFRSIKVMAYNYKSHKDFYIYSLIVLVILLRSILETSYTVFSIDFIILITLLGIISENKINLREIKNKFLNDKS